MKTAVMICNMGGPDSLDEVEPYLLNIFSDPDIIDIPLPEFLRNRFVRWLLRKRGPKIRDIYKKIGGRTPLNNITKQQAEALAVTLNKDKNSSFTVFTAMRYWHPLMEDVWQIILSQDFDKIVVLSLYPFYSTTTTGSMEKLIGRLTVESGVDDNKVCFIDRFGTHPGFIKVMVGQIKSELSAHPEDSYRDLLFSAHSVPMKRIKNGDPYQDEIEQAIAEIKKQLPADLNVHLSYQSKVGPVQWLSPATSDKIEELAANNVKSLLVYPLGFVADNSETIYEIDILYRELAQANGITKYNCIAALNTDQNFVDTLNTIIMARMTENQN